MFAALALLMMTGVMIFWAFNALSRVLIGRWHASEQP
jgi:NitT/TauT family transport system permease protein